MLPAGGQHHATQRAAGRASARAPHAVPVACEESASVLHYLGASRAPGTQRTYGNAEKQYREYCAQRGWLRDEPVRGDHALEWFSALADANTNPATIRVYRAALCAAWERDTPVSS